MPYRVWDASHLFSIWVSCCYIDRVHLRMSLFEYVWAMLAFHSRLLFLSWLTEGLHQMKALLAFKFLLFQISRLKDRSQRQGYPYTADQKNLLHDVPVPPLRQSEVINETTLIEYSQTRSVTCVSHQWSFQSKKVFRVCGPVAYHNKGYFDAQVLYWTSSLTARMHKTCTRKPCPKSSIPSNPSSDLFALRRLRGVISFVLFLLTS